MTSIKNGIKNIVRQPVRCLLFIILFFLVAILGSLGITIWHSADRMLKAGDELYKTRVTIQNETPIADNSDRNDVAAITPDDVISQNEVVQGLGEIENIKNDSLEQVQGLAMISFRIMEISQERLYEESDTVLTKVTAMVQAVWCGGLKTQQYIIVDVPQEVKESWNGEFEPGHTYFAYGKYGYSKSNYPVFTIEMPDWNEGETESSRLALIEDITETGKPSEEEWWKQYAEAIENTAEMFPVYAMDNATLWDEFYLGQTELEEGTTFECAEEQVCLVNDRFAKQNGLKVGDELQIRFAYSKTGDIPQILWGQVETVEGKYRVIGIYKYQEELENAIYISRQETIHQESAAGVICQLQLKNGTAEKFLVLHEDDWADEITVEVEDQGYSQAILPVQAIYRQALLITALGILLGVAAVIFVARNYYNSTSGHMEILEELGGGAGDCCRYFGSGLLLTVTVGAVAGFFAQIFLKEPLVSRMLERNYVKYHANLHYSQLSGAESFDAMENVIGGSAFGLLFAISLEVLAVFLTIYYCKEKKERFWRGDKTKKATQEKVCAVKRTPTYGAIASMTRRFSVQEFFRNGKQTAVFMLLTFFLIGLTGVTQFARENQTIELQKLYQEQEVFGYITAQARTSKENTPIYFDTAIMPFLAGSDGTGTVAQSYQSFLKQLNEEVYWKELMQEESCGRANDLYQKWKMTVLESQQYISDFGMSKRLNYEYMGKAATAAKFPDIPFHTNAYGNDWLLNQIPTMSQLVFGDNYKHTQAGMKNNTCYLDGYDSSFLSKSELICVVSEDFLQEHGLALGDEIRLAAYTTSNGPRLAILDVRIIGSYEGRQQDIYVPMGVLYGTYFLSDLEYEYWEEFLTDARLKQNSMVYMYYGYALLDYVSSFRFTIADNYALDDFRAILEEIGYSEKYQVNELRQVVVIEDGTFLQAAQNINRHIEQMNVIQTVLLILTIGISAFAVFVLIVHVKEEIYLMVELGTPKRKIVSIWFWRYGLAASFGVIPAFVLYVAGALLQRYALHMEIMLFVVAEIVAMLLIAVNVSIGRIYKEILQKGGSKNGRGI